MSDADHSVVTLDGHVVTVDEVVAVARRDARVDVTAEVLANVSIARARIEELAAAAEPKYGISTGFGFRCTCQPAHLAGTAGPIAAFANSLTCCGDGWTRRTRGGARTYVPALEDFGLGSYRRSSDSR